MLTYSILDQKTLFGQILGKNHNFQVKLKFGIYTNSNMHNLILMFTFSVFDWEYFVWANLVKKNQTCQFKLKSGT